MTPAFRWTTKKAVFYFYCFINCEGGKSTKIVRLTKTVFINYNFSRKTKAAAESSRGPSVYQPNALPLSQTGSTLQGIEPSASKTGDDNYEVRSTGLRPLRRANNGAWQIERPPRFPSTKQSRPHSGRGR